MKKLVFVTSNSGKFAEVRSMLEPHGVILEQRDLPCPEIQADSLKEVVEFALDWLSKRYHGPFLVDDSGLFIHHFHGFPGVYSSYVFRTIGNPGILRLMDGLPPENRSAHFETVFGIGRNENFLTFAGRCNGRISESIRGTQGFGYDSIFVPHDENSQGKTFGEMSMQEKNRLSHRRAGIDKMVERIDDIFSLLE